MRYRKYEPSMFYVKLTIYPVSNPSQILGRASKQFTLHARSKYSTPKTPPKTYSPPSSGPSATIKVTSLNTSYLASGGRELVKITTTLQIKHGKGKNFRTECRLYYAGKFISGTYTAATLKAPYPYSIWKNYWFSFSKSYLQKKLGNGQCFMAQSEQPGVYERSYAFYKKRG